MKIAAEFPKKLQFLFKPERYKIAYGGRGGTKWLCSPVMVFSYIMGHLNVYAHDILGRLRFL